MPFHIKKSESPAKGVRRVCHERIEAALGRLRKVERPEAVHGVRKEIKKLRALYRLVRCEIGRGAYRKGAKALREAAGSLNAPRDAQVILNVFKKLRGRDARRFAGIEKALQNNWRQETRRFRKQDSAAAAGRILRKTGRRVGHLKIKTAGWAAIEPGLKQSYQRGRVFYKSVRRRPTSENLHDWRKHVKDLWYYFCLLYPAWPEDARDYTDALELLGARLGEDHDLFLLQQFAAEHCAGRSGEVKALTRLIGSRQKALHTAALKLGSRLYAGTPADLCRRLKTYWSEWRRK